LAVIGNADPGFERFGHYLRGLRIRPIKIAYGFMLRISASDRLGHRYRNRAFWISFEDEVINCDACAQLDIDSPTPPASDLFGKDLPILISSLLKNTKSLHITRLFPFSKITGVGAAFRLGMLHLRSLPMLWR
jgi:hypothetical protein